MLFYKFLPVFFFFKSVHAIDWFNCDDQPHWVNFREHFKSRFTEDEGNFAPDQELIDHANEVLEMSTAVMQPNNANFMGYSFAHEEYLTGCNTQALLESNTCLFGIVHALFAVAFYKANAEGDIPAAEGMLEHAKFLLGSHTRLCLDFLESSKWPLSSIDILGQKNLGSYGWRERTSFPSFVISPKTYELDSKRTSVMLLSENNNLDLTNNDNRILRIWEIGVHASLSAEPLNLWANYVFGKFKFANVIEDQYPNWLPSKWDTLYGETFSRDDYESENPVLYALQDLFRKHVPHSSSSKDPVIDYDVMKRNFAGILQEARENGFEQYLPDVWLCTIFIFCTLPKFDSDSNTMQPNKSRYNIVGYFGHPMPFMANSAQKQSDEFYEEFLELTTEYNFPKESNAVPLVTSDVFLQMQYEYQTQVKLPQVRVHGSYIRNDISWHPNNRFNPNILVVDRPFECALMCMLQRFVQEFEGRGENHEDAKTDSASNNSSDDEDSGILEHINGDDGTFKASAASVKALKPYMGKKVLSEGRLRIASSKLLKTKPGTAKKEESLITRNKKISDSSEAISKSSFDHSDFGDATSSGDSVCGYNAYYESGELTEQQQVECEVEDSRQGADDGITAHVKTTEHYSSSSSNFPFQFITRSLTKTRSFAEFAQHAAVILFPYDMDLITFYEFYAMNVPIFMPSHLSKYMFSQDHGDYDIRYARVESDKNGGNTMSRPRGRRINDESEIRKSVFRFPLLAVR